MSVSKTPDVGSIPSSPAIYAVSLMDRIGVYETSDDCSIQSLRAKEL